MFKGFYHCIVIIVILTAKNYSLDTLLTAASTDLKYGGKSVHVTMVPNPSHLEVSTPVCLCDHCTSSINSINFRLISLCIYTQLCTNTSCGWGCSVLFQAVNAVALGKARARMQSRKCSHYTDNYSNTNNKVLCFQIHGDASFAGQVIFKYEYRDKFREFFAGLYIFYLHLSVITTYIMVLCFYLLQ